jgi:hypothetical protein
MTMAKIRRIIDKEPPIVGCVIDTGTDWEVRVPNSIRAYRDVMTVDDYLDRICAEIAPPVQTLSRSTDSELTIPMAISFLDAIWTARTGDHLFVNVDTGTTERLVQPCRTTADFDSCVSALAEVVSHLQIPSPAKDQDDKRGPLQRFADWSVDNMPAESASAIGEATDALRKIVRIRAGAQHSRAVAARAFEELGISYPPPDWSDAWKVLGTIATNALGAIRDEIQANLIS